MSVGRARFRIMRFWAATFLGLVWVHLAAAAPPELFVSYQDRKLSLGAGDLAKLPAVDVQGVDHQAKHRYSGLLVRDILTLVGAPLGDSLRGTGRAICARLRQNKQNRDSRTRRLL
jgi:hypothetical protein